MIYKYILPIVSLDLYLEDPTSELGQLQAEKVGYSSHKKKTTNNKQTLEFNYTNFILLLFPSPTLLLPLIWFDRL